MIFVTIKIVDSGSSLIYVTFVNDQNKCDNTMTTLYDFYILKFLVYYPPPSSINCVFTQQSQHTCWLQTYSNIHMYLTHNFVPIISGLALLALVITVGTVRTSSSTVHVWGDKKVTFARSAYTTSMFGILIYNTVTGIVQQSKLHLKTTQINYVCEASTDLLKGRMV